MPDAEVDDPLVADPIRIVDKDVQAEWVDLVLSQAPNQKWMTLFQNATGVTFFGGGLDFRQFPIQRKAIRLPGLELPLQELIEQVKKGITRTNQEYAERAQKMAHERVQAERRRLQAEADTERKKIELSRKLRI